jgi:tetratricopeptide (TPR) repeat protein
MKEDARHWFGLAADLPATERDEFLESHCPDEEMRREVRSLLAYDLDAGPVPLRRVGPFELGRILGSGGMGFVYEGHRVDGEVRQRVAVKFAQVAATASEEFRESVNRRFHRERQMLASLRHPYIAGLIDAGTTEDGIPYAVIEQVDGIPIHAYCDQHILDVEDRIRLVLKLCDAVQCAHRNLIVHSDIKPDNVLVTADGIPKLIDFGIASEISDDAASPTMRAFTPGYASPEHLLGLPMTVATDVYGLGAVLYRLLTGARPQAGSFAPPSTIKPGLSGDIENILMKSLHAEPQRRYGSVPEFADDLNRFLARRPVRATPDSVFYRSSRFVRRHWTLVLAGAMFVAALVGSTAVAIRERQQAADRARETRRLAERLLFEVHDEIGGLVGGTKARKTLGTIAVQYLEMIDRDHGRDPELAWELLNAYSRLGQSLGGQASSTGDTKNALRFATKTLELGGIVEAAAPDTDRIDRLFSVYAGLVPILEEGDRTDQRRETVERMLRLAPRLSELRQAEALKEQGRLLDEYGPALQAESVFAQSVDLLRRHQDESPGQSELISTLVSLGRAQARVGNFDSAVATLQEAIQLAAIRAAANPHLVRTSRQLYWAHISLADVLGLPLRFNLGRTDEAVGHYEEARRIADRLVGADPANEMALIDLARVLGREGAALSVDEPQQALELIERCQTVLRRASPGNHSSLDNRLAMLTSSVVPLVRLGQLDRARLRVGEAQQVLAEMRQAGMKADERSILKAEAIVLEAAGHPREALQQAQTQLALLPTGPNSSLAEVYDVVEVLERIQIYAAGVESGTCLSAGDRLTGVWQSAHSAYPQSSFIDAQWERARASSRCGGARGTSASAPLLSLNVARIY